MNGYPSVGAVGNAITGGQVGYSAAQNKPQQAPVHTSQEGLDKAVAMLLSEVDALHAALSPILTPQPPAPGATTTAEAPYPHSVAERINVSAQGVYRASTALSSIRARLEV